MMTTLRRKRIRLPADAYAVPGTAWLLSIATEQRRPIFSDPIFAGLVASVFEWRAQEMGVGLDVYCVMPDHVHLLLQVKSGSTVDYVRDVKSRTTQLWWRNGGEGKLWQRSFHDHGLRAAADYERAIAYIVQNPVVSGLVNDWSDYDLLGGSVITKDGE